MEWKEIGCNKEEIISKEIEESAMDTMICTLFTGQPVRRVFLCVIVMSLK